LHDPWSFFFCGRLHQELDLATYCPKHLSFLTSLVLNSPARKKQFLHSDYDHKKYEEIDHEIHTENNYHPNEEKYRAGIDEPAGGVLGEDTKQVVRKHLGLGAEPMKISNVRNCL